MTDLTFRSDVTVELIDSMASDASVLRAARVSTLGSKAAEEDALRTLVDPYKLSESLAALDNASKRDRGLINYLMRDRHGSPFEHAAFTFFVHAPIFVFREWHRHRIASINEESGRYKQLEPVFYVPAAERNLTQVGKPGAYTFQPGTPEQQAIVSEETRSSVATAYASYEKMLAAGVAREVARIVLPVTIYSSMYWTVNPRSLMNFLSLRTKVEGSHFPSFPQREIEMGAEQVEKHFAAKMPWTYEAFQNNGRVAP